MHGGRRSLGGRAPPRRPANTFSIQLDLAGRLDGNRRISSRGACGRVVCSEALRLSERRAISDTSSSVVVLDAGCF